MDQRASRNSIIAIGTFFLLVFVMMTLHSYSEAMDSTKGTYLRRGDYEHLLIKTPNNDTSGNGTKPYKNAKVQKEELGRMGWSMLHIMSINYPEEPTPLDVERMEAFLQLFGEFYPCRECGEHFLQMLETKPVRANSKTELVFYICELHNDVNKRLGKETFDCYTAEEHWGGDCGCHLDGNNEQNGTLFGDDNAHVPNKDN